MERVPRTDGPLAVVTDGVPGTVAVDEVDGALVYRLYARRYPGHPRPDEDTVGDRIDWLIDCLDRLDELLDRQSDFESHSPLAFPWLEALYERRLVEDWGRPRGAVWLTSRSSSGPSRAPPCTAP